VNEEEEIVRQKPKKRVRDVEEKIRRIYKTFFDLIQERGYSDVSTNHIADAAQLSIGTIYRYFPQGKASIIKQYFDTVQEDIFDIDDLVQASALDIQGFFKKFASQFVRIHRQNLLYDRAYEQAMLESREVFEDHMRKVIALVDNVALRLHQSNPMFGQMPVERVKQGLLLIFNVFEALTRRHLIVMPLFPTDDEFIEFLTRLLSFLQGNH
jgi:AcrR family transcriptional regulator